MPSWEGLCGPLGVGGQEGADLCRQKKRTRRLASDRDRSPQCWRLGPMAAEAIRRRCSGTPGAPVPNKTQSLGYNRRFVIAFLDTHFEVHSVVAQGDEVLVTGR